MKIDAGALTAGAPITTAPLNESSKANRSDADTAARQLEAFFLRQLLAETRPKGGMLDGGFAGDTFKQMLDDAIADKMSAAGGIGLAQMFARQLGKTDEVAALPPTSTPSSIDPALRPEGAPPFVLPVAGRITSGYGLRTTPIDGGSINHPGVDLAARTGTAVAAAAGGTVVHAGSAGTYGNLVTLRHPDGFETRYAHLSAVAVKVGDVVETGQHVGDVGSTGNSTGPHLHFEIRHDGRTVDPSSFIPLHSSPVRTSR